MTEFTQKEHDIWVATCILIVTIYVFTLGVLLYNVFVYLIPMKINKPLIVLYYVFAFIKIVAITIATLYPFF